MISAEERMNGIGGSECAAAAGLHPKLSREVLLGRKLVLTEEPQSWIMYWGKVAEDIVLTTLEGAPHFITPEPPKLEKVRGELPTKRHALIPWAFATVDGMVETEEGREVMLEIKTAPIKREEGWGKAGTDLIPAHYACQVLWNMAVLRSHGREIDEAWVLALFGTREPQRFVIPWDAGRAEWLFEEAGKFWAEVLDARTKKENAA